MSGSTFGGGRGLPPRRPSTEVAESSDPVPAQELDDQNVGVVRVEDRGPADPGGLFARLWWVPLVVGALVGVAVAAGTNADSGETTSAIVNTRAAADLPNERADLVSDLEAAMSLTTVLEPVAEANDLTVGELRGMTSVSQVDASSLARISVTSTRGEDFRRDLLTQQVEAVKGYLAPPQPPPALAQAQKAEAQARRQYFKAIENNRGLMPDRTLSRLQDRLIEAQNANNNVLVRAIGRQMPVAINKARRFAGLEAKLAQAESDLEAISAASKSSVWGGPQALQVDFESTTEAGFTQQLPVRRGLAAGLAAAVLVAALIALAGLARRRT